MEKFNHSFSNFLTGSSYNNYDLLHKQEIDLEMF